MNRIAAVLRILWLQSDLLLRQDAAIDAEAGKLRLSRRPIGKGPGDGAFRYRSARIRAGRSLVKPAAIR